LLTGVDLVGVAFMQGFENVENRRLVASIMDGNGNDVTEVELWFLQSVLERWYVLCDPVIDFRSQIKGHLLSRSCPTTIRHWTFWSVVLVAGGVVPGWVADSTFRF
jgi:hypothetical protein